VRASRCQRALPLPGPRPRAPSETQPAKNIRRDHMSSTAGESISPTRSHGLLGRAMRQYGVLIPRSERAAHKGNVVQHAGDSSEKGNPYGSHRRRYCPRGRGKAEHRYQKGPTHSIGTRSTFRLEKTALPVPQISSERTENGFRSPSKGNVQRS